MSKKAQRTINGTHGMVWINGQKLIELDSLELKITLEYEDLNFAEELGKRRKFIGWSGEGSMAWKKVFSRGAEMLAQAVKTGQMPEIEITSKLADPDSYGVERVTVEDVTFNEFILQKIEQKTVMTEETSFGFGDFDLLETIKVRENMAA